MRQSVRLENDSNWKSTINDYGEVLWVLGIVLLEIRATEDIKKARILADVVHNVPANIAASRPNNDVKVKMMEIAQRHGAEGYFERLFKTAESK